MNAALKAMQTGGKVQFYRGAWRQSSQSGTYRIAFRRYRQGCWSAIKGWNKASTKVQHLSKCVASPTLVSNTNTLSDSGRQIRWLVPPGWVAHHGRRQRGKQQCLKFGKRDVPLVGFQSTASGFLPGGV